MNQTNLSDIIETTPDPSSNLGMILLLSAIFLFGLHNLAVVAAVLKAARNTSNFYTLNLCISDGLKVASVLFQLTIIVKEEWLFGSIFCSVYLATQNICAFASPVFVTLITFDRYVSMCHPTATQFGRKFIYSATVLTWLAATSLSVPYMVILESYMSAREDTKSGPHCVYHSLTTISYFQLFTIAIAIRFIFPLVFLVIFSILAVCKLFRLIYNRRGRDNGEYKWAAAVLLAGMICQLACGSPHYILVLSGYPVNQWLWAITFVSTAINPVIYGVLNKNLRDEYREAIQLCQR